MALVLPVNYWCKTDCKKLESLSIFTNFVVAVSGLTGKWLRESLKRTISVLKVIRIQWNYGEFNNWCNNSWVRQSPLLPQLGVERNTKTYGNVQCKGKQQFTSKCCAIVLKGKDVFIGNCLKLHSTVLLPKCRQLMRAYSWLLLEIENIWNWVSNEDVYFRVIGVNFRTSALLFTSWHPSLMSRCLIGNWTLPEMYTWT